MEVILLQRVEHLGQMGDIVRVKPGYARNFLLPKGKAERATTTKIEEFKQKRAQLEAHNLHLKKEAEAVAAKMKGLSVIILRQAGENGLLYGSVRPQDIAESVTAAGFTVTRSQAVLSTPIKALGLHQVQIALHPEVSEAVIINVAQTQEEALAQASPKKSKELEVSA
jgi:large subunit ribosomal protein L9